jgi:hypothetical protein
MREASERSQYRCPHIEFHKLHQEYRRCSYCCRRNAIESHTWTRHEYTIPRDRDAGFPSNYRSNDSHFLDEERSKIHSALGIFAGESNLPARAAAGTSMLTFATTLLDIGVTLGRASPIVTAAMLLPPISHVKIGSLIREVGQTRSHEIERHYQSLTFVNLLCDAGTVQSLHTLYALATNPFSNAPPLIVDLVEPEGFCAEDYSLFFRRTLTSLQGKDLVICGVIVDHLAAQSLGLRQVIDSADNPTVRAIFHVPCFCHSINLVFANTVHACPFLKSTMDIVSRWEAVFRTHFARRVMGCRPRCPSIPKTRWLYATGPLRWILSHLSDIQSLILIYRTDESEETVRARRNQSLAILAESDHAEQFQRMQDALRLLEPLRILCDRFERRDASLSQVIPYVRQALTAYRDLYSARVLVPESYETFKHLLSRLIARMATSVPDLCATAYVLSPDGKLELRMREQGFSIPRVSANEDDQDLSGRRTVHDGERTADDGQIEGEASQGDSESSDDDQTEETFETDWDRSEDNVEEVHSYRTLHQQLLTDEDIEHMLAYPLYDDLMTSAANCITSLAAILGFSEDAAYATLHNWITTASEVLRFPLLGNQSPDTIWRNAHLYDGWRDFSEVAMRIVTLGTSEADVERLISVHRDIASLKSTRYSHSTIRNRLQLRVSNSGRPPDAK